MASRVSRVAKAAIYLTLTAALIGLGWWLQAGLTGISVAAILRALRWLLLSGVVLLGVGVFLRRGADARLLGIVGGGSLVVWLVLFLLYGGMDNPAATGADTACNLLMLAWTALPLATLIRAAVLVAATRADEPPTRRRPLTVALVVLIAWMIVLVIVGQMLHFVHL